MKAKDEWQEKYYGKWRLLWDDPNREIMALECIQLRILRDDKDAPWRIEIHVSECSVVPNDRYYQTKVGARHAAIREGIRLLSGDLKWLQNLAILR